MNKFFLALIGAFLIIITIVFFKILSTKQSVTIEEPKEVESLQVATTTTETVQYSPAEIKLATIPVEDQVVAFAYNANEVKVEPIEQRFTYDKNEPRPEAPEETIAARVSASTSGTYFTTTLQLRTKSDVLAHSGPLTTDDIESISYANLVGCGFFSTTPPDEDGFQPGTYIYDTEELEMFMTLDKETIEQSPPDALHPWYTFETDDGCSGLYESTTIGPLKWAAIDLGEYVAFVSSLFQSSQMGKRQHEAALRDIVNTIHIFAGAI